MTTPLIVGNWKMHGTESECLGLARKLAQGLREEARRVDVAVAPPFTALASVRKALTKSKIHLVAQNTHWEDRGAFTGEISPGMLVDAGCEFVIIGHSERRHIFQESDQFVAKKMVACLNHGLRSILCVGETLDQREKGLTNRIVARQLNTALKGLRENAIDKTEIAYEPVWAIGTGQNATPEQIRRVHGLIRRVLVASYGKTRGSSVRILYGGSVKPGNAKELLGTADVNGLLVGGASLEAESFLSIVQCV